MAVVASQSSPANFVSISPNSLSLVGTEGEAQLNRTLTFVGITNQTVNVTLIPTDLYDNGTGKTLSANAIEISSPTFNVAANQTNVNISLNISQTKGGGTYQGTIIVTTAIYNSTTNNQQIAVTNIGVSVTIRASGISSDTLTQIFIIVIILFFELVAFLISETEWTFKNFAVAVFGVSVVAVWIYMLLIYGFTQSNGLLTTIGTIVIVPFFGWVINYLNTQRTTENEKLKTSRGLETTGIKSDIDTIRDVLGELQTHYASFRGDHYVSFKPELMAKSKDPRKEDLKILYTENEVISRKVWDSSRKQGVMSDLPVLELEKYYDFVDIYNSFHSYAMELIANGYDAVEFLNGFKYLRKLYSELESVLFVNLSYYMGLFEKTYLSPLPIEFPRVTRTFLYKLIFYKILNAKKYPGNFKYPSGFRDLIRYRKEFLRNFRRRNEIRKEFRIDFEKEYKVEIAKEFFPNFFGEFLDVNKKDFTDAYKEILKKNPDLEQKIDEKFNEKVNSHEFGLWRQEKLKYPFGLTDFKRCPKEFLRNLSRRNEIRREFNEALKKEYKVKIAKKYFPKFFAQKKFMDENKKEFTEEFKKILKQTDLERQLNIKFSEKVKSGEFDLWIKHYSPVEKARRRIGEWQISAAVLKNIINEIYRGDNVPKFYKAVGADFDKKYNKLDAKIGELLLLAREFLEKESTLK